MANPIDTQGADSGTFIGSREKAKNGYGQNGDPNASSVLPGKPQPILGNPKVAPPAAHTANANATYDDKRLAEITKGGEPDHSAFAGRVHNSGSPSGHVGPVTHPVKK